MLNRYNEYESFIGYGMKNNGNTCYFNSLIQSLLSCTAVTNFFLNKKNVYIRDNNKVALEYIKLINTIKCREETTIINPKQLLDSIISAVKIKYPNKDFGNSRQEDSGELFTLFLDIIDDPELYKYFMYKYLVKIWCFNCLKQITESVDKSCILEVSYNLSGFTIENKDFKSNKFNTHLYQYMTILNDYICPKCKRSNCCKIYQLTTSPDILVIMFNKFYKKDIINFSNTIQFPKKINQKKILTAIEDIELEAKDKKEKAIMNFNIAETKSELLNVVDDITNESVKDAQMIANKSLIEASNTSNLLHKLIKERDEKYINYKLVSIINHSGSQNGGHYWANCLRNGSIYNLNDSSVSTGSFTPTREAYMLFYHNY